MRVEVAQHVEDGLEPEVLDVALPALVQRQAEVLQGQGSRLAGDGMGKIHPCDQQKEPLLLAKGGLLIAKDSYFFPAWLGRSAVAGGFLQNPTCCSPGRSLSPLLVTSAIQKQPEKAGWGQQV